MKHGFTLAELLIALAILGVIATFTIPKVLQSQADGKYKAIAKEAAGTMAQAYDAYRQKTTPGPATSFASLTPYLNYVRRYTGLMDEIYTTAADTDCSQAWENCYLLHNGAILESDSSSFNGTATTNAIRFYVDPDGKPSGSATGPGKSVWFWLYFNGRITTFGTTLPGTTDSNMAGYTADPSKDPPWFSWD